MAVENETARGYTGPISDDKRLCMLGKIRKNKKGDKEYYYIDITISNKRYSIYKDKNGISLKDSRQYAERVLSHIRYEIDHGTFDIRQYQKKSLGNLNFKIYVENWLSRREIEVQQDRIARSYFQSIKIYINKYLIPGFEKYQMTDLNEGIIEDWFLNLPQKLKKKTLQNIKGILSKILNDAYRRRDINRRIDLPIFSIPKPNTNWLCEEDQEKILSFVKEPYKTFYKFLMLTGLRPGEARALLWNKVDFKNKKILVDSAMDMDTFRNRTKEGDVSNLPISDEAITLLKILKRQLGGFVFNKNGEPLKRKPTWENWNKAAKKAELKVSLYCGTKHSFASQWIRDGKPLQILQQILRHRDIRSTLRYTHLADETIYKHLNAKRV